VDPKIISNPFSYKKFLEKENPTILQMTPSGWRRIVQTEWHPSDSMKLLSGGEALPEDLANNLLKHVAYIWNVYGPTETTIWSTIKKITTANKITIGKEIFNTKIFVVSSSNTLLPYGIAGELCIGGDGVTPGYINNSIETKKKFIQLKIDENNSIPVYKTGDKVKQLKTGELIFLGRIDTQIKKYGYRIELGEIETQLLKHKHIKNAAVCFDTEDENVAIKAYIVPKNINTFSTDSLTPYLLRFLPTYMIPNQYVIINNMPKLANGKINRNVLKNFKTISNQVNKTITEANYSLMRHLWAKVPNKQDIELDDNFFQVGGNSLIALKLLISIEKSFNRKIEFVQLIQYPTPRKLMNQLYQKEKNVNLVKKSTIPSPILRLNRVNSNKNIFLIHPIGGHIFWFASLAQYIKSDWNVYGIQDPGVINGNVYFLTLEEMCQFYQRAIKKIQPKGPYYLAGASFGATAAFEIAKELSKDKEHVDFVGLFDGWAKYPKKINTQKFMQNNMWRQYHEMETKTLASQSFLMKPIVDIHWQRSNMLAEYKLEYIPVPLTLFKPTETMSIFKSIDCDDNGWRSYTNKLDIIQVPGNHESIFYEDNLRTLSKKLFDCLKKHC
jgi:thioesterase domain-containing protein/acyl carrier protein